MEHFYFVVPVAIVFFGISAVTFAWAVRKGRLEGLGDLMRAGRPDNRLNPSRKNLLHKARERNIKTSQ